MTVHTGEADAGRPHNATGTVPATPDSGKVKEPGKRLISVRRALVCAAAQSIRLAMASMHLVGSLIAFSVKAIGSYKPLKGDLMNSIVYIVGLIVIIIAILSFFGLR